MLARMRRIKRRRFVAEDATLCARDARDDATPRFALAGDEGADAIRQRLMLILPGFDADGY